MVVRQPSFLFGVMDETQDAPAKDVFAGASSTKSEYQHTIR